MRILRVGQVLPSFTALLIFVLSVGLLHTQAQQPKTDSLKAILLHAPADTTRVNLLIDLARELYRAGSFQPSLQKAKEARLLAEQLDFTKGVGSAWLVSGYAYIRKSEYDSALLEFSHAKQIFETIGYTVGLARTHNFIGQAYELQSDYDEALRNYTISVDLFKTTSEQEGLASVLNSMGINYYYRGSYEIALDYYFQSLKISEAIHSDRLIGSTLNNIGVVYQQLEQPNEALHYYKRYLEHMQRSKNKATIAFANTNVGGILTVLKRYTEAQEYLDKALLVQQEINERRGLVFTLCFLGDIYRAQNKTAQAEKNYMRALQIANEIQDQELTINPTSGLSQLYIAQHRFNEAESYLAQWKDVTDKLGTKGWLEKNYLVRSRLDSARGNYKDAYVSYKRYAFLKDSLFDQRKSQQVAVVRGLYEAEKKDKEIQRLNDAKKLDELRHTNDRKLLITAIGIFMLVVSGMLYWLRHKTKTSTLLMLQKEEISKANEEMQALLEKIEQQNQILAAKNESLEDLHLEKDGMIGVVAHDLRSPLSKVVGLASVIELTGPLNDEQKDLLGRMRGVCDDGNALIRDLMEINKIEDPNQEVRVEEIDVRNFIEEAISNYSVPLKQKQLTLQCSYQIEPGEYLTMDPVCLVRILDNLLTNSIKFSPIGKSIFITVTSDTKNFTIAIQDQGLGFHPNDLPHLFKKFKKLSARPTAGEGSTGLGLSIVKALVTKSRGEISVESEWGKGAIFTLRFPIVATNTVDA
jgi:signal transduction histidine kinase/Tfp pilus assembly protein PilF